MDQKINIISLDFNSTVQNQTISVISVIVLSILCSIIVLILSYDFGQWNSNSNSLQKLLLLLLFSVYIHYYGMISTCFHPSYRNILSMLVFNLLTVNFVSQLDTITTDAVHVGIIEATRLKQVLYIMMAAVKVDYFKMFNILYCLFNLIKFSKR